MTGNAANILEVHNLSKRFGGLIAVKDISFALRPGEILGLIGPNGSGKSTVMKLVMGIEQPNSGSVVLDGVDVAGWPTAKIAHQGIGIVFQHSRPLHRQTVLENIKLALLPDSLLKVFVDPSVEERARAIARRVGLEKVLNSLPSTLPFADLRRIEMAKALAREPKVVLVDEPFAGLTPREVGDFSALIDGFRQEGRAVLLVDHNVKIMTRLVDRALAMYLGEQIAEGTAEEVTRNERVREVYVGGDIVSHARRELARDTGDALLQVKDISVRYGKAQALHQVALDVHEGEFVAVVGLNGAGKTTLFNAISGLLRYEGGIYWQGTHQGGRSVAQIARDGIVQCPETRELFGYMSVRENLELGGAHLKDSERVDQMAWLLDLFPVLQRRQRQAANTLSGGEQQMLAIARALMMKPRLLILDEPTLGLAPVILDQLSQALHKLRETTSITVLLGEQNVTFALPHADRIYVLEHGQIAWLGTPDAFDDEMGEAYL